MLNPDIRTRLESIRNLPTIPLVVSQVLQAVDDPETSAARLANIIERDQSLTARVLRVANSPFYGFTRKISTIDLAVVVLGMNTIKEIVLSLIVQRFFSKISTEIFDIKAFWHYSVFCGSASRLLARKLGYKLAGEAFVGGLMHDIGILIIAEYFSARFREIVEFQQENNCSLLAAEEEVLGANHCEIGAWFAEKWNLPGQLGSAIQNHHKHYSKFTASSDKDINFHEIDQPLTAIVSMSEWFASLLGYLEWAPGLKINELYLSKEVFGDISEHDLLDQGSAFALLKQELIEEYEKASIFADLQQKAL